MQNKHLLNVTVVLSFLLLSLCNVFHHEMWRDEMEAWMIAVNSSSLMELFGHVRYEGHPALWHLLLYFLSKIWADPVVMQLFHVGIATAVIAVVVFFSPFSTLQKFLFSFGYFPLFEYGAISRGYSLGILCVVVFCALYPERKKRYVAMAMCLFFLCQTSVYGVMICCSLFLLLILDFWFYREGQAGSETGKTQIFIAVSIILSGLILAVVQLLPPADSGLNLDWFFRLDLGRLKQTIASIWDSYVPLPRVRMQFWNYNILYDYLELQAALSALLLVLACLMFWRTPLVLLTFLAGTFGLLLFGYVKFPGLVRHHGHLLVVLFCCAWLTSYYQPVKFTLIPVAERGLTKLKYPFVTLFLLVHVGAAGIAVFYDWKYPFSASKETAEFIKANKMDEMLLVGDIDWAVSSVAGYLDKEIYYPMSDSFGTFVVWNNARSREKAKGFIDKALALRRSSDQKILLIFNHRIRKSERPLRLVEKFTKAISRSEIYYLYVLDDVGTK